jgi:MFS family permease
MLAAAFVAGFVVFGVIYSFGVFLQPMMRHFEASSSATSAYYAISSLAFYLLGPVTGRIGDKYGPRKATALGALLMAVGLAGTAGIDSLWMGYLTYGLGVGAGAACAYVPTFANLGGWFDRWRTTALGIAAAGTGCGMLVVPPLAAVLIESLGWRSAFVVLGAGSGALLAACALVVHPPPSVKEAVAHRPLREALQSREFRLLYVSWLFGTMALFVPMVFLPAYAIQHGADPVAASWLISILGGTSIVGRLGIGFLGDRIESIRLYKLAILAMAASYVLWLAFSGYAWLATFASILGFAYGIRITLVAPVIIAFFGVKDLGALLGFFFTATGLASLFGPLLASLIVDQTGSYQWGIVAAIVMGMLGFLFILPLKRS